METANTQTQIALKALFAADLSDTLHDEIETVYRRELSEAKSRTIAIAKKMIEAQLRTLPSFTFGFDNLTDSDIEKLAHGFMPYGVTLD